MIVYRIRPIFVKDTGVCVYNDKPSQAYAAEDQRAAIAMYLAAHPTKTRRHLQVSWVTDGQPHMTVATFTPEHIQVRS